MSTTSMAAAKPIKLPLKRKRGESNSLWADSWKRLKKNRTALLSGAFILFVCTVALFADLFATHSFEEQFADKILEPPGSEFWLGADDLGRDMYSRIVYGSRMSLAVGLITAAISLVLGLIFGSAAGWLGGRADMIMMRCVDILDSIPTLVLLILVKIFFDSFDLVQNPELRALTGMLLALSVFGWIMMARVVRGQVMQTKESLYVEAARSMGASQVSILIRHIWPNILGPIIVVLTFQIPQFILFESILSFIGLGLQPPFSSWGVLANTGWKTMKSYPHLIMAPSLLLFMTILAFNLLGDGLRDAFDPKMRGKM